LNNKPKWYTDLVPSTLVPAAKIEGELVYESKNICWLEARFSDSPLSCQSQRKRGQLVEDAETTDLGSWLQILDGTSADDHELATLQASFETRRT